MNVIKLSDKELRNVVSNMFPMNLDEKSDEIDLGEKSDEIFRDVNETQGSLISGNIIAKTNYSMNLIKFIKSAFYDFHNNFRSFSEEKVIYLIRWLCVDCISSLEKMMKGDNNVFDDKLFIGRWIFLQKYWNIKNMLFFFDVSRHHGRHRRTELAPSRPSRC